MERREETNRQDRRLYRKAANIGHTRDKTAILAQKLKKVPDHAGRIEGMLQDIQRRDHVERPGEFVESPWRFRLASHRIDARPADSCHRSFNK